MKRKLLACVLACTMAASLAGCGSSASQTANDSKPAESVAAEQSQASEESTPAEESAAETGELDVKSGTTLNVTTTFAGEESNVQNYQDSVKRWEEKYGCTVADSSGTADETFKSRVISDFEAGAEPDVLFYFNGNDSNPFVEAGKVVTIDEIRSVYPDYASNMKDERIPAWPADGKQYAVPFYGYWEGMYVNKSVCEQAGVEVPGANTTWDEFLEDCKKLKDAGIQPIVMGDKDQYVLQFGLYQLAADEIYSKNPDYDNQLRDGDAEFTDEGTWDTVLEMYKTLYDEGYIDASKSLGYGASQAITDFIDGKAAMTFDGSFNATALLAEGAAGAFERGYFPLPGTDGVYTATCLSAGYSIYSKSEHVDECKELLDYWMDGESDIWNAYLGTGKIIATYGNGADSSANYELFKPFVDLLNEGKGFYWCNQAWPAGTETEMESLFSEMVGGQGTEIEDITEGMQDKFEDLLDE